MKSGHLQQKYMDVETIVLSEVSQKEKNKSHMLNSAVMNIGVRMSLSILVSLVCMPSSGIAGWYGSSISSFQFFKESPHCSP